MKILFYPDKVNIGGHKVSFYIKKLNIELTYDINSNPDIIIHWDKRNKNQVSQEVSNLNKPIINKNCTNVKKCYVDEIFTRVFGYSSLINPEHFKGYAVKKTTQQAVHGGKIVECPTEYDRNIIKGRGTNFKFIYQRFVNNRINLTEVRDYRVPIFNDKIPIVFIKDKPLPNTFHPFLEEKVSWDCNIEKHFTIDEHKKIVKFAKEFGLDFGELDILRDNSDGKIYIVDVNNIAMGTLFNCLEDKETVITILSKVFKHEFIKKNGI
jgi:hypothetical protein